MPRLYPLLPAVSLVLLAACTSHAPNPAETFTLAKQSQCPARLAVGQHLDLTLPSLPTTGYRWRIVDAAPGVLQSLGPEVYSNPEDAGLVGGNGQSLWRFKVSAAGSGHLKLVSQQPWAPEVKPVQTFDCAIDAR
ncbi:protease inhibitor I42 family protein [Pseudomonas typographi]|uniref:Protease inhibitor I42 family protein n=1 Tax=Pseudomonas typographi TaxID=2715964 RepID=A0ABR7Z489_9PSED|nr:protease inhibitor I42 family protein [Pseudomonas typographi]MBD1552716.1 protease inhibitor I42 family protein [Pseudomonas typographi]MBD1588197.1 protease inhibitor I42 family protein [Pseudomonas typographi]MBD1600168.1 protease inhibitor I42 family protein [Pseudomonas typographi]